MTRYSTLGPIQAATMSPRCPASSIFSNLPKKTGRQFRDFSRAAAGGQPWPGSQKTAPPPGSGGSCRFGRQLYTQGLGGALWGASGVQLGDQGRQARRLQAVG